MSAAVGEANGEPTTRCLRVPDTNPLALAREYHDPRRDVDRTPCDLSVLNLDLATVQPSPNPDAQRLNRRGDSRRAPYRAGRSRQRAPSERGLKGAINMTRMT